MDREELKAVNQFNLIEINKIYPEVAEFFFLKFIRNIHQIRPRHYKNLELQMIIKEKCIALNTNFRKEERFQINSDQYNKGR